MTRTAITVLVKSCQNYKAPSPISTDRICGRREMGRVNTNCSIVELRTQFPRSRQRPIDFQWHTAGQVETRVFLAPDQGCFHRGHPSGGQRSNTAVPGLKSRCGQGWLLPEAPGRIRLLAFPASRGAHLPQLMSPRDTNLCFSDSEPSASFLQVRALVPTWITQDTLSASRFFFLAVPWRLAGS